MLMTTKEPDARGPATVSSNPAARRRLYASTGMTQSREVTTSAPPLVPGSSIGGREEAPSSSPLVARCAISERLALLLFDRNGKVLLEAARSVGSLSRHWLRKTPGVVLTGPANPDVLTA